MLDAYGACVDMSIVNRWAKKCKDAEAGASDLWDYPRSGRPVTAVILSRNELTD